MADIRARLAALRARRQDRKAALTAKFPANTDPALAAAAAAVGEPRQTWDADFKERLAGTVDESEDEADQIVVLPPPPVRLDPIAARIAWRKKAIAEANAKTQAILAQEFPVARLPAPAVAPQDEVNDEEELLQEQEVEDDEGDGDEEEGEDTGVVEGDEEEDEDEGADADDEAESVGGESEGEKADGLTPVQEKAKPDASAVKALLEKVAEKQMQEEKDNLKADAEASEKPDAEMTAEAPTADPAAQPDSNAGEVDKPKNADEFDASPVTPEDSCNESGSQRVVPPRDDSGKTVDSSRITAELATGSSSTAKSIPKGAKELKKGEAVTASSSRKGPFSKFFGAQRSSHTDGATVCSLPPPAPMMKSAFIDDEASDEGEEEDEDLVRVDSDSEEEDAALEADGIVADSTPSGTDAAKLAQFHRQWEEKQDEVAIGGGGRQDVNDVDNAMDLSELLQKQKAAKEQKAEEASAAGDDGDDAASEFCMGNMSADNSRNGGGEFAEAVDAMFRDDSSRGAFDNDMDLVTPEKNSADAELSKRKARALWKARQRNRAQTGGADERSISLLALFEGDAERENVGAARPPRGEKRKVGSRALNGQEKKLPEWERRRVILERVEKRRRTAVSMDQWSYASASLDRASRDAAPADGKRKTKRSGAAPVGGGSAAPKPASVQEVACVGGRATGRKNSKKGAKKGSTFKALFDVLDKRATTDAA